MSRHSAPSEPRSHHRSAGGVAGLAGRRPDHQQRQRRGEGELARSPGGRTRRRSARWRCGCSRGRRRRPPPAPPGTARTPRRRAAPAPATRSGAAPVVVRRRGSTVRRVQREVRRREHRPADGDRRRTRGARTLSSRSGSTASTQCPTIASPVANSSPKTSTAEHRQDHGRVTTATLLSPPPEGPQRPTQPRQPAQPGERPGDRAEHHPEDGPGVRQRRRDEQGARQQPEHDDPLGVAQRRPSPRSRARARRRPSVNGLVRCLLSHEHQAPRRPGAPARSRGRASRVRQRQPGEDPDADAGEQHAAPRRARRRRRQSAPKDVSTTERGAPSPAGVTAGERDGPPSVAGSGWAWS